MTLTFSNGDRIEIRADSPVPTKRERKREGMKAHGSRAERLAAKKEIFFRVLKETDDIKKAYKTAGVSNSTGYVWRKEAQGRGGSRRKITRRRYQREMNPRSRDFNQARNLKYRCRPCNLGFPSAEAFISHQEKKHGMILRAAQASATEAQA